MLLASLGTSSANVALPTLAQAFSASFQDVQWIVLAYLLAITTLIVSVGRIGDIAGRKLLLLTGLALFTTASVLAAIAPNLGLLIAARAVQGLGAAIMMALTMAMIREAVPQEKAGSGMGLLGSMSAIGTALGPSLGGVLIAGFGWRSIFLINVPLGILTWVLSRHYLPEDRAGLKTERTDFDIMGSMWLALSLGSYALSMTIGRGSIGVINGALLLAAGLSLSLFLRTESKTASPLIQLKLFRDPVLRTSLATSVLVATVIMATLIVGPFYLSRTLGLESALVGLVMTTGPLVAALTALPLGRAVDRYGWQHMSIVGLTAMTSGSLSLAMLPTSFGIVGYIIPLAFITAGYALFQTANSTSVMQSVQNHQRGVISGLLNLSRNLGLITGSSVMGAVFSISSGATEMRSATASAVAGGMRTTFGVAAVMTLIAVGLAVKGSGQKEP